MDDINPEKPKTQFPVKADDSSEKGTYIYKSYKCFVQFLQHHKRYNRSAEAVDEAKHGFK